MSRVALIPARGGSQRIPRKNIRPFLGRPMLAWPIGAARASGLFDRIVVSTDDDEIAAIARAAGAEVPFRRDPALADAHTGITEVIRDAIGQLGAAGGAPAQLCLIYATAPLVQADDLAAGLAALKTAEFAISVAPFTAPVQRALRIDDGRVRMMDPGQLLTRSQDLVPAFHDAGQFCWGHAAAWLGAGRVFEAPTAAIEIPPHRVQDIDTPEDWTRAELIARALDLGRT